jgi:hypothetical protein
MDTGRNNNITKLVNELRFTYAFAKWREYTKQELNLGFKVFSWHRGEHYCGEETEVTNDYEKHFDSHLDEGNTREIVDTLIHFYK